VKPIEQHDTLEDEPNLLAEIEFYQQPLSLRVKSRCVQRPVATERCSITMDSVKPVKMTSFRMMDVPPQVRRV
jgi:hypothetical protein